MAVTISHLLVDSYFVYFVGNLLIFFKFRFEELCSGELGLDMFLRADEVPPAAPSRREA
jgi:hypothetical protein